MPIIKYGNHIIDVRLEQSGEETVTYDGELMSSKMSTFGATHKFSVKEEGQDVAYEVKVKPKGGLLGKVTGIGMSFAPKVEVFREGKKIYSS
jgi:hypothetical protein